MDEPKSGLQDSGEAWPKVPAEAGSTAPIDMLKPDSELHKTVLNYLLKRLNNSEREMARFYDRWRWNEMRAQAYVTLPDYEKALKAATKKSEPPQVTSLVMPYNFATMSTIVTYLVQAFCGRKPMFQVGTYNEKGMQSAESMELMLQYNAEHVRLIKHLFQYFSDGELYGVQVLRTAWKQQKKRRSVFIEQPQVGFLGIPGGTKMIRTSQDRVVFEGTEVCATDPFMFFPDPRVPMAEVSRRGEYVFWRTFEGKHMLKKEEQEGNFKWIDRIGNVVRTNTNEAYGGNSSRGLLSQGDATPGIFNKLDSTTSYYQIDQGTIDIIPAELGLGTSENVERWIFAIGNKNQIIQAEKVDLDHGMHPVVVGEPYTLGYGFGQPGIADYLGPVQDTVSWFINSHIHNVRATLNNMFVVDPSMVEMQDLKNPEPGKIIRLKRSSYGRDVRGAIQQLNTSDVTRGHVNDLDVFMRIGDALAAVNDNLRGLQDAGGRKSATEARTSAEAAASRLAAHAKLISSQSIIDLVEQMSLNYQQFLSDSFQISVLGSEKSIRISPEMLVGDFVYPINDGTLPVDKVALIDVWKEVMMAVIQDQQLRATYSVPKLFAFVADLGGAKNLDSMKLAPQEQIAQQAQAGNLVPTSAMPDAGGQTPGLSPSPAAERMMGALG